MNKILVASLVIFVILSIVAAYAYYNSSVLGAESSYNYQGVCTEYVYQGGYGSQTTNPLYSASACSQLQLEAATSGAFEVVSLLLLITDIVFMVLYWVFEVRETNIRRTKNKG